MDDSACLVWCGGFWVRGKQETERAVRAQAAKIQIAQKRMKERESGREEGKQGGGVRGMFGVL